MALKHFILIFHLAVLVHGDALLDYAERSLEDLPNWIHENVEDNFTFHYPYYGQRNEAFMRLELQPWNITANGMKTIRLLEKPSISGSLFTGRVDINLTVIVDLGLSGNYVVTGELFPYVDEIPFASSGMWSARSTLIMTQPYHISMNVSATGSMNMDKTYLTRYTQQTSFSNFNFDTFLEDHLNTWYYAIVKEGFGKELEERTKLALEYDHIDVFDRFFEKVFKDINYSDIIGDQP